MNEEILPLELTAGEWQYLIGSTQQKNGNGITLIKIIAKLESQLDCFLEEKLIF